MFGLVSPVARALKANGVVGLNERNGDYVLKYNKRRFYPRVDDKLLTKRLAEAAGIATPPLYGVFETARDAANAEDLLSKHEDFVIKPSQGSGGDGIVVIVGRTRTGGYYRTASGKLISSDEIAFHLHNTISGVYSLGGQPDVAMVEYRVQFDPVFEKIAFQGVPDVRIVVFLGVPVMAMVRLPTRMSGGRANLHQGAIGAGIDIATGRTLTAVWKNDIVTEHPDTLNPVQNVEIPHWDKMLELAARAMDLTELGYQGIDIVLDRDRGPLILELNARPGLNIQIANRAGLAPRLKLAERNRPDLDRLEDRVAFAKEHFAAAKMSIPA
jgi:alpha-L-glutamate ligase-like protein